MSLRVRYILLAVVILGAIGSLAGFVILAKFNADLPDLIGVADYKPLLVTEVFDRNGKKIGEFFREKRILTPYNQFPKTIVQAFVAAEDDTFFKHTGINYLAMFRAFLMNLKSGRKSQGGSTITQQVARSLLLSSEKTYGRKIREVLLAQKMEKVLSKEDILYLYLNQIYLGQGANGVGAAAQVYFRKDVKDLTVPEAAILAGLPQAPSRYSPITNPSSAKERQRYVLDRMADVGFITKADAEKYKKEPVKLFVWQNFKEIAPSFLETVRQTLVAEIGEEQVLDKGIKVYTSLDLDKQLKAQDDVQNGLRDLDKRQGYRGPLKNLTESTAVAEMLLETRNDLMDKASPERILKPDGTFEPRGPLNLTGKDEKGNLLPVLPPYIGTGKFVQGIVTKVDDAAGLTYVRFAESKGVIDLESMSWARKPDPNVKYTDALLKKPSNALKIGDVIQVKVVAPEFKSDRITKLLTETKKKVKGKAPPTLDLPDYKAYALLELEQEPLVEGALLSIDQRSQDVISLVGGYDFARSKFNRVLQAARQTGSSFKAFVYLSALDKGWTPATPIIDAPVVFEEQVDEGQDEPGEKGAKGKETGKKDTAKKDAGKKDAAKKDMAKKAGDKDADQPETKVWRPKNNENKFGGDILFRNALIKSLNVPAVKVIEKVGVDWAATYARRLGIFSPLNMDFTLTLGSSSVTLYEMTRAFGVIGRLGYRLSPVIVRRVVDAAGKDIAENITLDQRFKNELTRINDDFEDRRQKYLKDPAAAKKEPPIFFADKDQLIKPQTAYVLTSILQGVIDENGGTGGAARALGRPVAGKTGTTNGFYDAWFVGFTPDIVTGVWVGFDEEKTLGRGEVGAHAALPIWLDYMKTALVGLPPRSFPVPDGIVFANIDNETGKLVSNSSKSVVRQAFIDGTEPGSANNPTNTHDEDQQFFKEELAQ
jgi:penicillin-binding protein 1A